jgi:hypothetical protein
MRAVALVVLAACSGDSTVTLAFTADPGPPGSERYVCFGFDAALLHGADIGALSLDAAAGAVTLHHVALYAVTSEFPDGPIECETMPSDATSLHVWALGNGDLVLDPDVSVAVPAGAMRLVVQAHVLRANDGSAAESRVLIEPRAPAVHRAAWLPLRVPTPAINPHETTTSSASCVVPGDLHVISTWPHMHLLGTAFHGSLVDVDPFVYDAQRAYPVDVVVAAGATIDSACTWQNPTDAVVLPGPKLTDEMCEQAVIAWPLDAARCE